MSPTITSWLAWFWTTVYSAKRCKKLLSELAADILVQNLNAQCFDKCGIQVYK